MKTITLDDEYSYTLHQSGSISTLPVEPEDDTICLLYTSDAADEAYDV